MKIVQLITAFQLGGAEKVALDIATNLKNENLKIHVLTIFKNDSEFSVDMKKTLSKHNIKYTELGIHKKYKKYKYIGLLISILQVCLFFIKTKPDIVHSHTDLPDFVLSNTLKIFSFFRISKPDIVRTIHNTQLWPSHYKIGNFVEKSFIDESVVYISKGAEKAYISLRKRYNLKVSKNTFFINNGINLDNYIKQCSSEVLRKNKIILSKNKINFLFAGRFVEQKGFDLMLDAFSLINRDLLKSIEIFAFGTGELEKSITSDKYSAVPLKHFPPSTELHLLYGCFDFLIMPSRFEGLPLVALESLSSQLPIIASNAPGLIEATPSKWPFVFENEDVEGLKNILIKIIDNKMNTNNLGSIGRKFIEEKFNITNMIEKYTNMYVRLD